MKKFIPLTVATGKTISHVTTRIDNRIIIHYTDDTYSCITVEGDFEHFEILTAMPFIPDTSYCRKSSGLYTIEELIALDKQEKVRAKNIRREQYRILEQEFGREDLQPES